MTMGVEHIYIGDLLGKGWPETENVYKTELKFSPFLR